MLKCSKSRSRAEAAHRVLARRAAADPSRASRRPPTGVRPYTLPVENAAIRLPAIPAAIATGSAAFIAHVSDSCPLDPNFRPAM